MKSVSLTDAVVIKFLFILVYILEIFVFKEFVQFTLTFKFISIKFFVIFPNFIFMCEISVVMFFYHSR